MSTTRKSTLDDDGVRTSTQTGGAATAARLLGILLVSAALLVIASSVAAVWWLRHDPGKRIAVAETSGPVEAPRRITAHAVRPVGSQATVTPTAELPERPPKPLRRAASAPGAPVRAADAAPASLPAGASVTTPEETQDADAERIDQRENREIEKTAQDVIDGMRAAGATTGLAAFPPPGTNPVKSGVVVPKDFPLPEGYIRYYQTTDDGKRLEPILMFSPDYAFVDDQGKPIELPKDGIAPPEMAPPGMPVRELDVPADGRARRSRSGGEER